MQSVCWCRKSRVLLLRGDSIQTLKDPATLEWIAKCPGSGAKGSPGNRHGKVSLFLSDRPFNILTKGKAGLPLVFDNMAHQTATDIVAAEMELRHNECRVLSRVSPKSGTMWQTPYTRAENMYLQNDLTVTRLASTCKGPRWTANGTASYR